MPMLDDRTRTPDPHVAPMALWSYEDSATAWPALLGDAAGGPAVPPTASPARLEREAIQRAPSTPAERPGQRR